MHQLRPIFTLATAPARLAQLYSWAMAVIAVIVSGDQVRAEYLSTRGAKRGVETILSRVDGTARLHEVAIDKTSIRIQVQGMRKSHLVDEWAITRGIPDSGVDRISDPRPVSGPPHVDQLEGGFFDLSEVALDRFDEITSAAIARAALEGPSEVARVRLAREIISFPKRAYGGVRWEIRVTSGREVATIYASGKGAIISVDLSETLRAKRLNLIADHTILPTAAAEIGQVLGQGTVVHDIAFHESHIFIRADRPSNPKFEARYIWDLNGLRDSSTADTPSAIRTLGVKLPFAFSDVDFTILPTLKEAAFKALGMEGGRITRLQVDKPANTFGAPYVVWEIEITSKDEEKGRVVADAKGKFIRIQLPAERRVPNEWLSPRTVEATLARLADELGHATRLLELVINDRGASVTVEDPRKPGTPINLVVDEDSIKRFGKPLFDKVVLSERAFTITDLKILDADAIEGVITRTLERLELRSGKLSRISISRGDILVRPPDGSLLMELRAEAADGSRPGRVVFALNGGELDIVGP